MAVTFRSRGVASVTVLHRNANHAVIAGVSVRTRVFIYAF